MMETKSAVKFDPGYAQHTTILSISTEIIYSTINKFKNLGQKKMKFKMYYPQLLQMIENNVGFCLGSMLWATYIKGLGDLPIEGNPCLGGTYDKDEAVEEVDFSIAFFEQFKKDVKYYLGTDYIIDSTYIKILELYKEFLILNCGFVNTKSTVDVQLPANFVIPNNSDLETINTKIQEVIVSGKLMDLVDLLKVVYNA